MIFLSPHPTPQEHLLFCSERYDDESTHEIQVHVRVCRCAHKERLLHETDEAPVRVRLIMHLSEHRSEQVRHTLSVANFRVAEGIVQQNIPETSGELVEKKQIS